MRLTTMTLLFSFLFANGKSQSDSTLFKQAFGLSINHLIWSNHLGLKLTYEHHLTDNKSIKIGLGYYSYLQKFIFSFQAFPDGFLPTITDFNGLEMMIDYKIYKRKYSLPKSKKNSTYFAPNFTMAYYRGIGTATSKDYKIDFTSIPFYQKFNSVQKEITYELNLKAGRIFAIFPKSHNHWALDIWLGLGYQVVQQKNNIDGEYIGRLYYRKLKGPSYQSYAIDNKPQNSDIYSTPVVRFGVDLLLVKF